MLVIADGPELTCKNNQTVMQNVPFSLNCTVKGFPKPELTFYKDDEEIELKNKLTREDEGLYKIHASNSQKTVMSQIEIFVYCKSLFGMNSSSINQFLVLGHLSPSCLTCWNCRLQTRHRKLTMNWRTLLWMSGVIFPWSALLVETQDLCTRGCIIILSMWMKSMRTAWPIYLSPMPRLTTWVFTPVMPGTI